jgi:hypothetical protein
LLTLDAPNNKAILFVTAAVLLEPLLESVTAPVRLLPVFVNVIAFAPAVKLTAPAVPDCVIAPVCEMPAPVSERPLAPTLEAATDKALLLYRLTVFALLVDVSVSVTAPVKLLVVVFSVIAPVKPLKVTAPAEADCVIAPVCEMPAPVREIEALPSLIPAITKALES